MNQSLHQPAILHQQNRQLPDLFKPVVPSRWDPLTLPALEYGAVRVYNLRSLSTPALADIPPASTGVLDPHLLSGGYDLQLLRRSPQPSGSFFYQGLLFYRLQRLLTSSLTLRACKHQLPSQILTLHPAGQS